MEQNTILSVILSVVTILGELTREACVRFEWMLYFSKGCLLASALLRLALVNEAVKWDIGMSKICLFSLVHQGSLDHSMILVLSYSTKFLEC